MRKGSFRFSGKVSPAMPESSGVFLVIFYPAPADRRDVLVRQAGLVPLPHPGLLPSHVLAAGLPERARHLAHSDEVAYVLPASDDLISGAPLVGCSGALVEESPIAEYAASARGWPAAAGAAEVELSLAVGGVSGTLPESTVRSEIARAADEWSRYARLRFTPGFDISARRTIAIRLVRGPHGDPYPLDGPGGVLGHSYFPAPPNSEPAAGDVHLDADEPWGGSGGPDFYSVMLHELGHALGLAHSDRPGAVMYPYYRAAAGLSDDDIAAIRELYGERRETVTPSSPGATPPPTAPPPSNPPVAPPPPGSGDDSTAPSVRITSPAFTVVSTSSAKIVLRGTASDDRGVVAVKWSSSSGASGDASGAASWEAAVPLLTGNNTVTIRAYDAAGNSGWRSVTVVRR